MINYKFKKNGVTVSVSAKHKNEALEKANQKIDIYDCFECIDPYEELQYGVIPLYRNDYNGIKINEYQNTLITISTYEIKGIDYLAKREKNIEELEKAIMDFVPFVSGATPKEIIDNGDGVYCYDYKKCCFFKVSG